MVFAVVLAGGIGSRMGNTQTPKQYLQLGSKPIIVHTVEKFYVNSAFEKVIVLCPKAWIAHTRNMLVKSLGQTDRVEVIEGGASRNDTVYRALCYIEAQYGLEEDTVIVTHDAVRPFVTHRIITENIAAARAFGACDTVIPATDTIVESTGGESISHIPPRSQMYQGQTPQSFLGKKLKEVYESLSQEEKDSLTDACKIFVMKGLPVHLVEGEVFNIKITYPYDLKVAQTLLGGDALND